MLLVAGPMPELFRFLQILSWIILPMLTAAAGLTIYFHFRNKKEKANNAFDDSKADRLAYKNENGDMVYFDHSALIREYKKRLSTAKAKNTAMQKDLSILTDKYAATARYARILFLTNKTSNMENLNDQFSSQLHEEIEKIAKENTTEKQAMQQKIEQLEQSISRLVHTNKSLNEQIKLSSASDDEKLKALQTANEELADLKEKLMGLEYLEEVLDEKKSQITFLQDQLENRIRAGHQLEHQRAGLSGEVDRLRNENLSLSGRIDILSSQAENAARLEALTISQKVEIEEKEQLLAAGAGELSYLKSQISELKNQHEMTAAALADCTDRESRLQDLLTNEQNKSAHLHHKLQTANTLLRRIQKEILHVIPEDENSSPVIQINRDATRKLDSVNDELAPALI